MQKKILVTGAARFIGFHQVKQLVNVNYKGLGLDNLQSYYDVDLKLDRLEELGIPAESAQQNNLRISSSTNSKFVFVKLNLEDRKRRPLICPEEKFDIVCNLTAQAGVRYSIENPEAYITIFSNVAGILELSV